MGKNCLNEELPLLAMLQAHAQSTHKNAFNAEQMGIPTHVHMRKTTDYQKTLMLFVVNPVNLHLAVTAFMTANLIYSC